MRAAIVAVLLAACGDGADAKRVLFIRGASGTGGFVEGGTDDHLCDIGDTSTADYNHGYGELAALLRDDGFAVEQVIEPVAIENVLASTYAVVVFGSNNVTYDADDADALRRYIDGGGGALFASDGNWGTFWDKAPSSDQTFLTQFGLVMNQDGGPLLSIARDEFVVPSHPIFDGVDAFEGEGTSPCSLAPGTDAVLLAPTRGPVRRNTAPEGPVETATSSDASLSIVEYGRGRVACHFDRNTFFNENGAGTSLAKASNRTYARNLFAWLAGMTL